MTHEPNMSKDPQSFLTCLLTENQKPLTTIHLCRIRRVHNTYDTRSFPNVAQAAGYYERTTLQITNERYCY